MEILGWLLAGLMGVTLGLLGGGGSILTVPILVYVLGFGAKEAIAMSLLVVGLTSLAGTLSHWRAGNVNVRVAAVFGLVAMVSTYGGARLSVFFSGAAQLAMFAVVMLVAAVFLLRGSASEADCEPQSGGEPAGAIALEGAGVGLLTGLVGVGGGFVIVPALVLLGRIPFRIAVGTSLAIITMNSAAGFAGYLGHVVIPWGFVLPFSGFAVLGVGVGTWMSRFVSAASLKRGFAVFLVGMGCWILWQNRSVLTGQPSESVRSGGPAVEATA